MALLRMRLPLLPAALLVTLLIGVNAFGQSGGCSNAIKGGGFEGETALLYWGQESLAGSVLIQEVGSDAAHGGLSVARLGGALRTVDTLDQFVGALPVVYGNATLSFSCRVHLEGRALSKDDQLLVFLVDGSNGDVFPVGTVTAAPGDWATITFPVSASGLGLRPGRDYLLRFEATTGSDLNPVSYDLDDVSLMAAHSAAGHTSMALPTDPPEPPDTVPDEDGDMPYISTPGITFVDITPHRDLPNICSCGYLSHQEVEIRTLGFTESEVATATVKFKIPNAAGLKLATVTDRHYDPSTGERHIKCIVPDAPGGKNWLGSASVKVKASDGKKASSPEYHFDAQGNEKGFWYGFPDKVLGVQLLSTATPSVLGGETFQARATGMATLTKYRPAATPPRCGGEPNRGDRDFVHPAVFMKDGSNTKVQVVRTTLNPAAADCNAPPVNWTWSGTWSRDGAPVVCSASSPCIPTDTPLTAVFLNPDNVTSDGTLSPRVVQYKTEVANFLQFSPPEPARKPAIGGVTPDTVSCLGGKIVSVFGSHLKRVTKIYTTNQGPSYAWSDLHADANGNPAATVTANYPGWAAVRVTTKYNWTADSKADALYFLCQPPV